MAVKALKDKLEEQLQSVQANPVDIIDSTIRNIVPFGKPEEIPGSVVPDFVRQSSV